MSLTAERHKIVGLRSDHSDCVETHPVPSDRAFEAMRQIDCKPLQCLAPFGFVSEHERDQVLDLLISDLSH